MSAETAIYEPLGLRLGAHRQLESRLDHLLASAELTVEECRYEHGWRTEGLSDHSALVVSLSSGADTAKTQHRGSK